MTSQGFRYSSRTIKRARELRATGLSYERIAKTLRREQGVEPAISTVQTWVNAEQARRRAARSREFNARYRRARRGRPQVIMPALRQDTKVEVLRELRDRGLTIKALTTVACVVLELQVNEDQLRRLLAGMGIRTKEAA